jgi:hypothetical protein
MGGNRSVGDRGFLILGAILTNSRNAGFCRTDYNMTHRRLYTPNP